MKIYFNLIGVLLENNSAFYKFAFVRTILYSSNRLSFFIILFKLYLYILASWIVFLTAFYDQCKFNDLLWYITSTWAFWQWNLPILSSAPVVYFHWPARAFVVIFKYLSSKNFLCLESYHAFAADTAHSLRIMQICNANNIFLDHVCFAYLTVCSISLKQLCHGQTVRFYCFLYI